MPVYINTPTAYEEIKLDKIKAGMEVFYTIPKKNAPRDDIHGPFSVIVVDGELALKNRQGVEIPINKFPKTLVYWRRV